MNKKSTERVRAYRQRQRAIKPPKRPPKTGAERAREYRARQKAIKQAMGIIDEKVPPKTGAERARLHRARQKYLKNAMNTETNLSGMHPFDMNVYHHGIVPYPEYHAYPGTSTSDHDQEAIAMANQWNSCHTTPFTNKEVNVDSQLSGSGDNEDEMLKAIEDPLAIEPQIQIKSEPIECDGNNSLNNFRIDEINHQEKDRSERMSSNPKERYKRSLRKIPRKIKQRIIRVKRDRGEDEFDIFGKHVAAQLRRLEEEECIEAEEQIQSVLSQARLRSIMRFESGSSSAPHLAKKIDDCPPSWNSEMV